MLENSDNTHLFDDGNDPELGEEYADWLDEIYAMEDFIADIENDSTLMPTDDDLDDIPF